MTDRISSHGLQIAASLHRFIEQEALPGTDVQPAAFWEGLSAIIHDLAPKNRALLAERDRLQAALDHWYAQHPGPIADPAAYRALLTESGYLQEAPAQVAVTTANVDVEITAQAGPQLVVPVMNARYALNAANARWGSLYDALYGTDAIPETDGAERSGGYNPVRGAKVIAYARRFLDDSAPLQEGSPADANGYSIANAQLPVTLQGGTTTTLADASLLQGYRGTPEAPEAIVLRHNGLHIEIQIDRDHPIGSQDAAGVKDVVLEAAVTTIIDCEDSVATVDAEDKT